jgi:hypothetical protein
MKQGISIHKDDLPFFTTKKVDSLTIISIKETNLKKIASKVSADITIVRLYEGQLSMYNVTTGNGKDFQYTGNVNGNDYWECTEDNTIRLFVINE